jgi:serine protease Do
VAGPKIGIRIGALMTRNIFRGIAILIASSAFCAALPAQPLVSASPTAKQRPRPMQMAKLIINLKRGERIGSYKEGGLIKSGEDIFWNSGTMEVNSEDFESEFRNRMRDEGYFILGDPSRMFESQEYRGAEFLIGGSITKIDVKLDFPNQNRIGESRGSASVDVEWQIFSQLERRLVATVRTTGTANRTKYAGGGRWSLMIDAFGDAVRQLARSEQFSASFVNPAVDLSIARAPSPGLVPMQVRATGVTPKSLADAVQSTALILAMGGEGSGFLISSDGYLLTNHHVVGESPYVKVRWPDGSEVLGEVVRSDKHRDVAILKADPKGRAALPLRLQKANVGEDVYAIGSPTGARFQNSVTKGIVSAIRVFNGYNFIQSDVGVTHGNSGGPILDAKGQVVGLTDLGFDDAPMVNLFIPIDEALSFLGLQTTSAK